LTLRASPGLLRSLHFCALVLHPSPRAQPVSPGPVCGLLRPVPLRSVLLTEDSAFNTLSLRPVPRLSPFPVCSVFRDLALLACSRIAPLPCCSRSSPLADCSAPGSWRSVRVYGLLRTLTRSAPVLLTDCSVLNTLSSAPLADCSALDTWLPSSVCGLLRSLLSAPCCICGSLRACRFERCIEPVVLRARYLSLRPAHGLLHARDLTLCALRRLLRASHLAPDVSCRSLRF
jgi:hypothetical protein